MAYPYFNPYYSQPMPDNLMQMRQMQQPQMQPMQQFMSQPVQQNPIAQGGVQWVSGEQEARGYLIAPNSAVAQEKYVEFVTREEFDRLAALVGEIKGKKKRKVEEDEDDE